MPGGGSDHPANDPKTIEAGLAFIKMRGNETFKVAVKAMADVTTELLTEQGFTHEQVDVFIPHQANLRIIDAVGERLKIDPTKVYKTVGRYGNTSAASIDRVEECPRWPVKPGMVSSHCLARAWCEGVLLRW
jgi:3-oxoacyl-[acyl-carrier-protein] synthase-3